MMNKLKQVIARMELAESTISKTASAKAIASSIAAIYGGKVTTPKKPGGTPEMQARIAIAAVQLDVDSAKRLSKDLKKQRWSDNQSTVGKDTGFLFIAMNTNAFIQVLETSGLVSIRTDSPKFLRSSLQTWQSRFKELLALRDAGGDKKDAKLYAANIKEAQAKIDKLAQRLVDIGG